MTIRLSLDKEDVEAAGGRSADDVLLAASLSAKWEHGDAIDRAMVEAVGGDKKVQPCTLSALAAAVRKQCTPGRFNLTTGGLLTPDKLRIWGTYAMGCACCSSFAC